MNAVSAQSTVLEMPALQTTSHNPEQSVIEQMSSFTHQQVLQVFTAAHERLVGPFPDGFEVKLPSSDCEVEDAEFYFDSPVPYRMDRFEAVRLRDTLNTLLGNCEVALAKVIAA
jgi:predicted nucleotidyltransferase